MIKLPLTFLFNFFLLIFVRLRFCLLLEINFHLSLEMSAKEALDLWRISFKINFKAIFKDSLADYRGSRADIRVVNICFNSPLLS